MAMITAQPTPEHAEHFAQLTQIASDNLYTNLLGKQANRILEGLYGKPDNDNSYQFTHFLEDGKNIAGMVNGWTASQKQNNDQYNERLVRHFAGWRYIQYISVGLYLSEVTEFIGSNLDDHDFYIQIVALYPEFRGRGHSKTLLQHANDLAVSQDCRRMVLDVDERNTVAIKAYEKVGFTIIDESKKRKDDGIRWGMLRMGKALI